MTDQYDQYYFLQMVSSQFLYQNISRRWLVLWTVRLYEWLTTRLQVERLRGRLVYRWTIGKIQSLLIEGKEKQLLKLSPLAHDIKNFCLYSCFILNKIRTTIIKPEIDGCIFPTFFKRGCPISIEMLPGGLFFMIDQIGLIPHFPPLNEHKSYNPESSICKHSLRYNATSEVNCFTDMR